MLFHQNIYFLTFIQLKEKKIEKRKPTPKCPKRCEQWWPTLKDVIPLLFVIQNITFPFGPIATVMLVFQHQNSICDNSGMIL